MCYRSSMGKLSPFVITLLLLLLFLFILTEVEGARKSYGVYNDKSVKLFVFGDSYLDTGNFLQSIAFRPPYGVTFPGKPAGRFSYGRVLTDYVASFLKIETPVPYSSLQNSSAQNGINFAYGGTGIFQTYVDGPNLAVQIDSFEKLIEQKLYTKLDLESSVALVNTAANDYLTFVLYWSNIPRLNSFTESLVGELSLNLKRIHNLGINKIAVGLLQPVGCLPASTLVTFHYICNEFLNSVISRNHNQLLLQSVQELNQEIGKPVFITLDLYNSFLSIIETMKQKHFENSTLMNPLRPCCEGFSGGVEYKVCENPELSFFWDIVHPSQNGWNEVYSILQSSLGQLTQKNV